jgi:excisionase family DNA binding protein
MQLVHPSDLLTAAELADRLGVKPGTILVWHRQGKIPARKLSHKVLRFDLRDVLTALESPQEAPGQEVRHG